ncbi:MAG: O-antigen translocase [Sedimentisphaerales bacterium]|nr:O-antigen translocase [Sedimentisphaerales bacterium]
MNERPSEGSYGQILKSTTLVGGSQVINILIGIVRTKFMAVLLGPAGVGLMGMYQAATGIVGTVTGLGISSSGVRQIAEAAGSGDETRIARTIYTLRRISLLLGVFGMLVTMTLSPYLSRVTFGTEEHAWAIAVLGVTLFLGSVSGGQAALVQGMRRIADLASMSVLGALLGTVLSVPIIYFWGESGIVPSLLAVSAMIILPSWWYARKVKVRKVSLCLADMIGEARGLLSLGLAFMASSVMGAAVLYLTRVLVVRKLGMESVGLYQAATTLSTMYIGVILNAMGMDFYPRLTAVANDNVTVNRLVNEQTEVGLLLATPGLLATLAVAPYVIHLFYSAQFVPAYQVLRWQILGIFLRVVAWPIGFVLLAKGKGRVFFWTELVWNLVHVGFIWLGLRLFGLIGTGIAFFVLYVTYTAGIFAVVNRISGFRWSAANIRIGLSLMAVIGSAFLLPYLLPEGFALMVNAVLTIGVTAWCLREVYALVGPAWFTDFVSKLKDRIGFSVSHFEERG